MTPDGTAGGGHDKSKRDLQQSGVPTMKAATTPPADDADERFPPGTLLADRYRIVGRLGRGGMGEVYRADDLKLAQSVALKFLPPAVASDETWLRRLHHEVRIAREVAHPNVCRTYDIDEVDGEHFITMEYVDGEDLSILLRRIGRLPPDKAVEIARQLCAGLAAAHDKGVLHRDLKPANVMLDGRGHVRITDFGIAALAENIGPADIKAGTPFYMAPEQLEGESVSVRSDIYSLGLVLYEVYTGKEAYHADTVAQLKDLRRSSALSTPSSLIADIDPTVERVIMRCLENDPADRPSSAIAVAAALPGGDPLAMALAAGETPSPEMLVQAGERGGLRPWVAMTMAATIIVCLVLAVLGRDQTRVERFTEMDLPPAVLAHRAAEIAETLGYTDKPANVAFRMSGSGASNWIKEHDPEPERWRRAADLHIPLAGFVWRSAAAKMTPRNWYGQIRWNDPPQTSGGMIRMQLDPSGNMLDFNAVPGDFSDDDASPPAVDWDVLVAASGVPVTELEPVAPTITPPHAFDARAAWRWTGAGSETVPLRIEAASWRGRVVWMSRLRPWNDPAAEGGSANTGMRPFVWVFVALIMTPLIGSVVLAARNMRAGRVDRRGAFRLAIFFLALSMGEWVFLTDTWISSIGFPLAVMAVAFARATAIAVMVWLFYVSVEPFARRYWPRTVVSWTRLLSGRWRDPLVGRDLLIGVLAGSVFALLFTGVDAIGALAGVPLDAPGYSWSTAALGGRHMIGALLEAVRESAQFIGVFVLLLLARLVLRRTWLALAVVFGVLATTILIGNDAGIRSVGTIIVVAVVISVAVRFGLLALATLSVAVGVFMTFPTTFDFSAWYASTGLVGPLALLALAGFGFWTALAGQPIFKDQP